jgi:NAD-dependent protein deacetylase/lipoamidase
MPVVGTAADLASLIRGRGPAVMLTGAGMSTESGIPDFRSASGIWADVDPFEVASIDAFRRDPLRVWRWYGPRIRGLLAAEPNAGHVALAALERAGHVRAVVTQNIDLLHTRAGSGDVIEVHGSIARFPCLACGGEETLETVLAQLETREAPLCTRCETIVKPGVVMFGELLPAHAMERAERLARAARLLVVVGSSLQVWPVAGLPADTARAGGALAIVNLDETPYDEVADVVVRGASGHALAEVARALGAQSENRVV